MSSFAFTSTAMSRADHLLSITSSLFRLLSFVFLRVIPLRVCKTLLPVLFMTYAILLLTSEPVRHASVEEDATRQHGKRESTDNGPRRAPHLVSLLCAFILTRRSSCASLRRLSLFANALLLLFVADFVTHPIRYPAHDIVFTRIGAVDHGSAKLTIRYPDNSSDKVDIKVLFRVLAANASESVGWTDGPVVELSKQDDWVGTTIISNLWPSTAYEYKLAFLNSSSELPYPSSPRRFKTFPDPRLTTGTHFRFIVTSCILPNFPYVPGKGDRIKGFDLMAEYLSLEEKDRDITSSSLLAASIRHMQDSNLSSSYESSQPDSDDISLSGELLSTRFLLLLGDFIYADVPVYYGDTEEAYRRLYRRTYASRSFRKIYERLPTLHIYDDHEILNNFAGRDDDSTYPFPNASNAFELYNARANYDSRHKGQYYYDFRHGDVAFFVLDTRRYRSSVSEASENYTTMLGNQQFQALQIWLAEVNQTSTFKFIISSVPFTTLWQHDAQIDSWAAYRRERSILLETLHTVPNLFILSGDRHEFAAIEFNGPFDWSHTIYEFSTSPLNMFYVPFIRTLEMTSAESVERTRQPSQTPQDGSQAALQDKYLIPKERVVRYLPVGNHKWTSFEVDTRNFSKPTISAEVMIDGRQAYSWNMVGAPVPMKKPTSLSLFVPHSLRAVLGKFGLESRNWF